MPKELRVSDESYNSYNVRVITAGGRFERFNANPVMLYEHETGRGSMPPGTWTNLRVEGSEIFATPAFDSENDEFAAQLAGKYERGIVRSASLGLRPLKVVEDGMDENGNFRFSITEWELMEISLVSVPSNQNAVAFYDDADKRIDLSAVVQLAAASKEPKIEVPMKFQHVPGLLGLSAEATDDQVAAKINELKAEAGKVTQLHARITELEQAQEDARNAEIETLLSAAVNDQKITAADKTHYLSVLKADFAAGKAILEGLQPRVKLSDVPKGGPKSDNDTMKVDGMTFSEMQRKASDKLAQLKVNDFTTFNALYKSEFGKDYLA